MTAAPVPRLQPIPAQEWDEESRAMLRGKVDRADQYLTGEPDAPRMPNVLGVLGHHVKLAGAWFAYNGVLLDDPVLDPRLRELMILRVAWRTSSTYEWVQHVRIGIELGITTDEIAAIARNLEGHDWTTLEALLLAATDQLLDQWRIDDSTWSRLREHLDSRQLIEALFVVGSYSCLAMVFNSVDLEPDPGMDVSPRIARPPARNGGGR